MTHKILVVDDNIDAAESLAMCLSLNGRDTRIANDPMSALKLIESFEPSVALLDIGLPGMTGYELAARIRAMPAGRDLMLIAITGWGQEDDKRRAAEAGFDHHLTKPVEIDTLERLMQTQSVAADS